MSEQEMIARLRVIADRREAGVQRDMKHHASSGIYWDAARLERERASATVTITLADLTAILITLSRTP